MLTVDTAVPHDVLAHIVAEIGADYGRAVDLVALTRTALRPTSGQDVSRRETQPYARSMSSIRWQ